MAEFNIKEKDFKGATAIKDYIRKFAFDAVVKAMIAEFGEENVTIINHSEVAVAVGTIETKDGFILESCVTFSPTVKDYKERQTNKRFFEAYDRKFEGSQWQKKVEEDKKEAEEKAKQERKNREKVEKEKAAAKAKKEAKEN